MECQCCGNEILEEVFKCSQCSSKEIIARMESINKRKKEVNKQIAKCLEMLQKNNDKIQHKIQYEQALNKQRAASQREDENKEIELRIEKAKCRIERLKTALTERKKAFESAKNMIKNMNPSQLDSRKDEEVLKMMRKQQEFIIKASEDKKTRILFFLNTFRLVERREPNSDISEWVDIGNGSLTIPLLPTKGLLEYANTLVAQQSTVRRTQLSNSFEALCVFVDMLLRASRIPNPLNTENGHWLLGENASLIIPQKWDTRNTVSFNLGLERLSKLIVLLCLSNNIAVISSFRSHPLHNLLCFYDEDFQEKVLGKLPPNEFYESYAQHDSKSIIQPFDSGSCNRIIRYHIIELRKGLDEELQVKDGMRRDEWPAGYFKKSDYQPDGLFHFTRK